MSNEFKRGRVTGTGAAINIELGFSPEYVKVFNPNDAGAKWPTIEWVLGFGAGVSFKTLKTLDNATTGDASSNKITTNGISLYDGTLGDKKKGFTIGADTDINVSGEEIFWIAMRQED